MKPTAYRYPILDPEDNLWHYTEEYPVVFDKPVKELYDTKPVELTDEDLDAINLIDELILHGENINQDLSAAWTRLNVLFNKLPKQE
jgi:hypothetical protein